MTRTVVFVPSEYAIVVDQYPPGTGLATTYWHIGPHATNPPPPGQNPSPFCATGDGQPNTTMLSERRALARFYNASLCPAFAPDASLYVLPLHPIEITSTQPLRPACTYNSAACTPTLRVEYDFNADQHPTREQVLFPQEQADFALVPTLAALDPDDSPSDKRETGSGFDLTVGMQRDVTLINHVPPLAGRTFGGQFRTDANVAYLRYQQGVLSQLALQNGSFVESATTNEVLVEAQGGTVTDLDVRLVGSEVDVYASPSQSVIRLRAPATTVVRYNGVPRAFSQDGEDVVVDLGATATELRIDPAEPIYSWENAVFELDVTATDANGLVASDFNGAVTVTATPASLELSLDNFDSVLPNPAAVQLAQGYRHIYVRGKEATIGGAASLTVTYSGTYGSLASAVKQDIHIDSLETVPYTVTTTTLPGPTTTTTTTTTTIPRENALYENFESDLSSEWINVGVQLWSTQPGNADPGEATGLQMARFNNADVLQRSLSLCGYRDVKIQWTRMTKQRTSSHHFKLWWYNGSSWVLLEDVIGNSDWQTKSFSLPSSANDNPNFAIKIESVNTGSLPLGFVDDIYVTGTAGAKR